MKTHIFLGTFFMIAVMLLFSPSISLEKETQFTKVESAGKWNATYRTGKFRRYIKCKEFATSQDCDDFCDDWEDECLCDKGACPDD